MADKEAKKKVKAEKKADKKKIKAPKAGNGKHWFKDFRAELKKVIWPTKCQLAENTTVVISMVVIVAVIIFLLDLAFKSITGAVTSGIVDGKKGDSANNTAVNTVVDTNNNTAVNTVIDTNNETVENTASSENAQ